MFLSIVIPVYNASKYITKCLDSIWSQNLPEDDYEVICVDDGSRDDSLVVLNEIAKGHPNLRILQNPQNLRAGGARNNGVRNARGEYILFIDSDDYFHSNNLFVVYKLQKESRYDILMANNSREYIGSPSNNKIHNISERVFTGRDFVVQNGIPLAPWKYVFKRTLMINNKIWFVEKVSSEDVDWVFRLTMCANTIKFVDILLVHYLVNPAGQTGTVSVQTIIDACRCSQRLILLYEKYKDDLAVANYLCYLTVTYYVASVKMLFKVFLSVKLKYQIIKTYLLSSPPYIQNRSKLITFVNKYPHCFLILSYLIYLPGKLYSNIHNMLNKRSA